MNKTQLQFGYRKPSAKRGGLARRLSALAMSLLLVCSLPLAAFADTWYLEDGDITVNATESGQTVSQGAKVDVPDSTPVITQKDSSTPTSNTVTINVEENATTNVTMQDVNIVISDPNPESPANHIGEAAVTIDVADDAEAKITLKDVNIDVSGTSSSIPSPGAAAVQITGNGDVTLELDGSNTVQSSNKRAGVEKNTISATDTAPATGTGKLTITDENGTSGSLEAIGGIDGAGIGSGMNFRGISCTNITITGSAQVTATGGNYGAGIGGGRFSSGSGITITGSAQVKATGGVRASGIGSANEKDGSNITISGNAQVTAQGGDFGSGIGGGCDGYASEITITGSAQVTARGGVGGSGIGGGKKGTGSNITISEDAQVKAQGGNSSSSGSISRPGAAIGNGGVESQNGQEVAPNTDALNEGWVATYDPSKDMKNDIPKSLTYRDDNETVTTEKDSQKIKIEEAVSATADTHGHEVGFTVGDKLVAVTTHNYGDYVPQGVATCTQDGTKTATCTVPGCTETHTVTDPAKGHSFTNYISNNDGSKTAKCDNCDATDTIPAPGSKLVKPDQSAPLYWVTGQDGKGVSCETEWKDGVLTITVEADSASLTGYLGGLQALSAQGIDTIVFVTNGATSTFALADLLATITAGDSYTLTHDGETVTFTLSTGTDISGILK